MIHALIHWFQYYTGTINEPGPYYGFWSGFGSDLGELTIFAAVFGAYRKVNCHKPGCPRIGKYPAVEGGGWHYCKKHHKDGGLHR